MFDPVKEVINNSFKNKEPWQIVSITSTSVLCAVWMWNFIFYQDEDLLKRIKNFGLKLVKCIPSVREKIDKEMKSLNEILENEALNRIKGVEFITKLPLKGLNSDEILEFTKKYIEKGDYKWKEGKVSGAVYRFDDKLIDLMAKVYGIASYTNPLHPEVFPGVCKMEAEIVRIACNLFHGDDETCGTMTSGGTESILLACKAYRDYARKEKGIKYPEMVVPVTVHSAFDKAGQYLKIKIHSIPVKSDYTVDVKAMKSAINSNTILLAASAPNFPYGTMDDIEAISNLGLKYNIPVHVDSCLGGFLLCFMPDAGFQVPDFDFKLPGVTSISADTHKYGYSPKGSSVILYKDKKYRHYQYTITTDWPGGIYGSPTVSGSRAGGIIAACWSSLMYFGHEGYVSATKKIINTTRYIISELNKIDDIYIFGAPFISVIALGSNKFHIYRLANGLNTRGWNLNILQFPSAIHICITYMHTEPGVAESFIDDVKDILIEINKNPNEVVEGQLAMYGKSQSLPDRTIVQDLVKLYLDSVYFTPKSNTINTN